MSAQPTLAWQFQSSNVDSVTGLAPNLSTTGTFAAPTGGTVTTVAGNRIHTFTTAGTTSITFLVPVTAQVLVIGAGAGGGGNNGASSAGGGGGAGEYYYSSAYSIAAGTYTVTVGNGGSGGVASTSDGVDGGATVFGSISAAGGGGGSTGSNQNPGRPGGSGGGCGRTGNATTGGASVKTAGGLGNKGGDNANSANFSAGGGGGSASAGTAASASGTTPILGGAGTASTISGTSVTYASGGNGGARSGTYTPSGGTYRGDGGDGAPAGTGTAVNGAGGNNGIVIISYVSALYPAPTYVTGKYGQAINFNNTLSASGQPPNCYVTYDVSSFNFTSNAASLSLWLNSGLTYPVTAGTNPFYINLQGASYNGLYTPSATSNISFRTGAAPIVTVGNAAAQTSIWNHYCAVFSNVGAGASNTITSYYFNGSLVGSANNSIQTLTTLNIGCQNTGTNGALCSIDDVRLFNTALTAAQVQTIYAAQGMPNQMSLSGSGTISYSGAPLFSQLSASAASSAVGAFSLRAVNGVSTRAVQIKRQSDNATQDFWADGLGNLLTAPVVGQNLTNWLGGATGYVTTWYDQTGNGRHATGTQSTISPTSNVNLQWAVNPTNGGLSLTGGAFLNGTDFTIVCTTKRLGTQGNDGVYGYGANTSWVSQASVPTTYGNNTRFALVMPNAGSTTVALNDSSYSPAFSSNANVLPSTFVAATEPTVYTAVTLTGSQQRMYINGAANGLSISTLSQLSANASTGFTIGAVNYYGNFLGEIGELIIFNSALAAADISTLYSYR
jgi:hypothetical protein